MALYDVSWSMYGTARIEADSETEAQQIAAAGCMHWSGDIDWRYADVDGCDIEDAEEV